MQLAPMNADDMQFELTGMMAAMGPGIPQAEKTEFMTVASLQLEQFPANLAREALHEAVSEVDQLRKVLPFVKTYCEDYPDRKRRRLDLLLDLQTLEESECG